MSDSYDLHGCVDDIFGGVLKEQVLEHLAKGGMFSVRPDSGKPDEVVVKVCMIFFLYPKQGFDFVENSS